jgi:predicted amidohydrolase
MKDKVKVAALQPKLFGHLEEHKEENLKNAIRMIREAASRDVEVVCLPELFLGGMVVEPIPGPSTSILCDLARELGIYIVAHLWERAESERINPEALKPFRKGNIYSSSPFISPSGKIIDVFRKVHLFPWEPKLFNCLPGERLPVYDVDFGIVGILICHDLMVPESARVLALKKAEIIFVPSMMPMPFLIPWRDIMRVRALENQVFMVSAGVVGQPACGTIIVAPKFKDEVLAEAGSEEQIICAELDLSWLREHRVDSPLYSISRKDFLSHTYEKEIETHCFLKDRRPELYQPLIK